MKPAPRIPSDGGRPSALVIATGILIMLSLFGALTLPLWKSKLKKPVEVAGLMAVFSNLKMCMNDTAAWRATIADKGNAEAIRCLNSSEGCVNGTNIALKRVLTVGRGGTPNLCLPGFDLTDPRQGLTADGQPCKGFSDRGNPRCPFRLELTWLAECFSNQRACQYPAEQIIFAIRFKEGTLIKNEPPNFSDGVSRPRFRGKQTFAIYRSSNDRFSRVVLAEVLPPGFPAGICQANGVRPSLRVLNTALYDPNGYSVVSKSGVFLRAGTYDCKFSSPGFRVGSFRADLVNPANMLGLAMGSTEYTSAAYGSTQVRSRGVGRFELTDALTPIAIVQQCTQTVPGPIEAKNLSLGVPMGIGPEIYSYLDCRVESEFGT